MGRHPRLSWLAACALLFACGGDPAPKQVEQPRSGFKSKKKKHKDEDAEPAKESEKKSEKPPSKEDKEAELEREAEKERQERKERQRKREQEEADEKHVAATDEGGSSDAESDSGEKADGDDADAKKAADEKKAEQDEAKAKKKAAREEALAKKKAAREEALAKKKAAAEEAKAKKLAAAEAKKNKKKKKGKEDADEATSDEAPPEGEATKTDEETAAAEEKPAAEEETPKAKKKGAKEPKEAKAKKKVAKADDEEKTSDEDAPKAEPKAKARKGKTKDKAKDKAKEKDKEKEKDADEDGEKEPPKEAKADEESIDMEEKTTASIKDPSHDSDELDLTSTPKETKEEETAPPVPTEIDRRPLTAAKGKLEVHGGLRVGVLTLPNGMGGSVSSTSEGLALGATYGLGGKAEVGFDYTVGLNPGSAKGPLLFHGAYRVAQGEKFDMALAAGFAVDFVSVKDPTTMMTSSQTATALQFGGWARYHVGRTLSLFTGLPALPSSSGNLSGTAALPPLPYQLTIGLSSKGAIGLDVPVGAGFQATPKIYAFASLDLAHLGMSNTNSAFLFADFIPLALGGFYTANKIDIGAVLGDDLKQGVDYLRFDVVARYSLK